jgi:hypothetical protein
MKKTRSQKSRDTVPLNNTILVPVVAKCAEEIKRGGDDQRPRVQPYAQDNCRKKSVFAFDKCLCSEQKKTLLGYLVPLEFFFRTSTLIRSPIVDLVTREKREWKWGGGQIVQ